VDLDLDVRLSGVPTQHAVESGGVRYYGNCAWDALGIPAALGTPARVRSRCEWTLDPLEIEVTVTGLVAPPMLFHCALPAARADRPIHLPPVQNRPRPSDN
jgi:hypothetical protein